MKIERAIMKTKLTQRLIQVAAITFLIWIVAHDIRHLDFNSLIVGVFIGTVFLARWIIPKMFPELKTRRRFFGKLVWFFMCLTLFFIILGFADFNASTSGWFVPAVTSVTCCLVFSYFHHEDLSRQLAEKEKANAVEK